jgi:hypothetical protein
MTAPIPGLADHRGNWKADAGRNGNQGKKYGNLGRQGDTGALGRQPKERWTKQTSATGYQHAGGK